MLEGILRGRNSESQMSLKGSLIFDASVYLALKETPLDLMGLQKDPLNLSYLLHRALLGAGISRALGTPFSNGRASCPNLGWAKTSTPTGWDTAVLKSIETRLRAEPHTTPTTTNF